MSTFEKLFVRIFERKRCIVDQLNQQTELYDQSLASKCLIQGIQPPSWLLKSGFQGATADLKELKKEDLISGLLFPPPRPNYSTTTCHNRPLFSENNQQYSDTLYTGTCAADKDLDVRDCSMPAPNVHLNEATTSLPDQILEKLSDTNSQCDALRERIQRSSSKQKTPNYEQVKSEKTRRESYRSASAGKITRSRTSTVLHADTLASPSSGDAVDRSIRVSECHTLEGSVSPPHQAEAKFSDINSQKDNSLEMIHRCRSTQTIPLPLNNDEIQSEKKRKKSCSSSIGGRIKRLRTSSGLRTDTRALKISFDAGNSSMKVSECLLNEAISSPYHEVARMSDTNLQLDNSVARIQRSNSGKMSPVPLTKGEGKLEQKRNESYSNAISPRTTRSRSSSGLLTAVCGSAKSFDDGDSSMLVSVCDLHKEIVSPPRTAMFSDVNSQLDKSLAKIQRSRSRQKALVLRSVEIQSEKRPFERLLPGDLNRDILKLDTDPVKISFGETSVQMLDVPDHQVEKICAGELDAEANKVLVTHGIPLRDHVPDYTGSSDVGTGMISSQICAGELDAEDNKVLVVSNESGVYLCDEKSISPDFNRVANSSLHQTHGIPLRDHVPDYTGSSDVGTGIISSQIVIPKSANIDRRPGSPYLLRNSVEPDNRDSLVMSDELFLDMKSVQARTINNNAPEHSWPQCKRRKIEDRSSNVFTTSPILIRGERLKKMDRNVISELHSHVQHELELNHVSISADVESSQVNVNDMSGGKVSHCAELHGTKEYGRTPSVETEEGDQDMEDRENGTNMSMGLTERQLETSLFSRLKSDSENAQDHALEPTDVNTSLLTSEVHSFPFPESVLSSQKMENVGTVQGTESVIEDWLLSSSVRSLNFDDLDLNTANQSMPVFEGFSVDLPTEIILSFQGHRMDLGKVDFQSTTSERISVLERLCRYTTIKSPLSDFSEPKNHSIPDVYPSTPNGNFDCTDMANGVPLSNGEFKQLESNYILSSAEPDRASYSGCMRSSDVELDLGMEKPPCTPPVRMLGQRITSVPANHSFEKSQSVNPELMCFRIDEDTCTSEENDTLDEVADAFHEDRSPRHSITEGNGTLDEVANSFHGDRSPRHSSLSNRKPLVEMTNSKNLMSISTSKTVHDRGSINSVNTEPYMYRSQIKAKQNLRNNYGQDRGHRKDKENQNSLVSGNGVGNYGVKTRLSRKASSESQSSLGKGPKRGNIVSNVSSFVPLVHQKQKPAAFATGKRDVKVKALEAAEAAKRLEEKRENDRKMKKAAAKLERARLEEAKLKQLELKQKKEVEERKKKESELAARKRVREDDDRKENERKRKRIEDKKDHKRRKAADGKESMQTLPKPVAAVSVAPTITEVPEIDEDSSKLVVSNLFDDDAKNRMLLLSEGNGEPSYDISPYQVSDDEKEDDDDEEHIKRKKKFIPSWAREKSLDSIMPYMDQVDPFKIFLPTRVCNIVTVLSARNSR